LLCSPLCPCLFLYLRLCACSCLLVLLVLLLLVLVTRLYDHARCLCCRGNHGLEHAIDELRPWVVLVGAILVLRGVLVASRRPACPPTRTGRPKCGSMLPRRCPRRRSGCPCTWRRAWPRAPPSGLLSRPRGLPRMQVHVVPCCGFRLIWITTKFWTKAVKSRCTSAKVPDHGAIIHRNGSWWSKTAVLFFFKIFPDLQCRACLYQEPSTRTRTNTAPYGTEASEQPRLERGRSSMERGARCAVGQQPRRPIGTRS